MPQALSLEKGLAVAGSLQLDLPHETIVKQTNVSLRQVQRIKHNLVIHGSIRKPKVVQQGRKSKITPEMEEVSLPLMMLKLQGIAPIFRQQNRCIHRRNGLFHLGRVQYHGISFLYETVPQTHEMESKKCM
jgi:hypothetical protein